MRSETIKCPECGHFAAEHTFWNGCTNGICKCQNSYTDTLKMAYNELEDKYNRLLETIVKETN